VEDAAIGVGRGVVGLVDDQVVEGVGGRSSRAFGLPGRGAEDAMFGGSSRRRRATSPAGLGQKCWNFLRSA